MRLVGWVLAACAFGWALLSAAEARYEARPNVEYQVVVRTVEVEVEPEPVPTPVADSVVDWDEQERQSECLWVLLQDADVEMTLEVVLAAGTWADARGGACLLIGEDDE